MDTLFLKRNKIERIFIDINNAVRAILNYIGLEDFEKAMSALDMNYLCECGNGRNIESRRKFVFNKIDFRRLESDV